MKAEQKIMYKRLRALQLFENAVPNSTDLT